MFAETLMGMGRSSIFESAVDPELSYMTPETTLEECVGDPFEYMAGVYYETEMNMVNINQAIMVCEYAYLKEHGYEMVYESNVIVETCKKIKAAIKKAFDKVCAFFKKLFSWLENAIRSDKSFVKKYEDTIDKMDGPVDIGSFEGYSYSKTSTVNGQASTTALWQKAAKMLDIVETNAQKQITKDTATSTWGTSLTKDSKSDEILDSIRGEVVGESSVESGDFSNKVIEALRGDKLTTSKFTPAQLKDFLGVIKSTKASRAALDAVFKAAKGTVQGLYAAANKMEKKAKLDADDKDSDDAKGFHVAATVLNGCTGMLTLISSKAGNAITAHNRQCKKIVAAAVAKYNKDDDKKKDKDDSSSKKNDSSNSSTGEETPTNASAFIASVFDSIAY